MTSPSRSSPPRISTAISPSRSAATCAGHEHPLQPGRGSASVRGEPSVARELASAKIVIYNGVDYDPWMAKLVAANKAPGRRVIVVGELLAQEGRRQSPSVVRSRDRAGRRQGDHGRARRRGSGAQGDYEQRLQAFIDSLKPIAAKIAEIRKSASGISVTATEPVFGYMATALGFKMRNERFQLAVMNNAEPRLRTSPRSRTISRQARQALLLQQPGLGQRRRSALEDRAGQSAFPWSASQRREPQGKTFQQWMEGRARRGRESARRAGLDGSSRFLRCNARARRQDHPVAGLPSPSRRASSSACSGPTAPARRRSCAPCSASCRRATARSGCSARRRRAATPRSAICRRRAARASACGSAAGTSSPAPPTANASACRFSTRRALRHRSRARARRRRRARAAPDRRAFGRRAPAAVAGQALLGRPRLLLLDEPLISLDRASSESHGRAGLGAQSRRSGITVLFSAHEINPLVGAIDRVLYLGKGQAAIGTVDEVITAPVLSRLYGTRRSSGAPRRPHLRHGRRL